MGYTAMSGGQMGLFQRMFEGASFMGLQAAAAVSLYVTVGQPLALLQAEFMKDRFGEAIRASFTPGAASTYSGRVGQMFGVGNLFGDLVPWMPTDINGQTVISGQSIKEAVMRKSAEVERTKAFYDIDNSRLGFITFSNKYPALPLAIYCW